MIYPEKTFDVKGGQVVLRSAREEDWEELIRYLKVTAAETPFLIREPDEAFPTEEREKAFIRAQEEEERGVMLLAFVDGELAGNASLSPIGARRRYAHRCGVAIALYEKFWGRGIGRCLLKELLELAEELGYEQAELEVVEANTRARGLYESLGFRIYGREPHNMKYADGSYADTLWMMKQL